MTVPPVAAALAVVALWSLVARDGSPSAARRRLDGVTARDRPGPPAGPSPRAPETLAPRLRLGGAAAAGGTVGVLLGVPGLLLGPVAATAVWWFLGRLEPAAVRRRREAVQRELPPAADLLLACVEAGAPPAVALHAVGEALGGVVGEALRRAAHAHDLGTPFTEVAAAWRADPVLAALDVLGRPLARSEDAGTSLRRTLRRVADDLRAQRAHRAAAAARRAGVRTAAPLGLCFLPAFVLVGLVPVVVVAAGSAAL